MTTSYEIYGLRVRQARLMRRLTATSVLCAVGWKGARLTRLEHSECARVTEAELDALASELRFPAAFFRSAPITKVGPRDLSLRAPTSTKESEKNRMAQFMALCGDFLLELDCRHKLPPVRLVPLRIGSDIVVAAAHGRKCLGIDERSPIDNLTALLERGGVPVLMRTERFGGSDVESNAHGRLERHLGCSAWVGEFGDRPLVMVRELDSWERTRWALAHEIGHLLLHKRAEVMTTEHEDEASRFAAEFLAPIAALSSALRGDLGLRNLIPLKQRWGISLGALLTHFYESGGLQAPQYEMLRKQLYSRINADTGYTWGRTEPGWNDRLPERPRLMSEWMEFAYGASAPEAVAARQMTWPADVLAEFLVGQRGISPEKDMHERVNQH